MRTAAGLLPGFVTDWELQNVPLGCPCCEGASQIGGAGDAKVDTALSLQARAESISVPPLVSLFLVLKTSVVFR